MKTTVYFIPLRNASLMWVNDDGRRIFVCWGEGQSVHAPATNDDLRTLARTLDSILVERLNGTYTLDGCAEERECTARRELQFVAPFDDSSLPWALAHIAFSSERIHEFSRHALRCFEEFKKTIAL